MAPHTYPTYPIPKTRIFLGREVWPTPFYKLIYPFLFTFTGLVFLNRFLVTTMQNDPYDKWNRQIDIVNADSARGKLKAEASAWYQEQQKKNADGHH
ncbi:hypothetical protein M427DRAFT_64604 [Gonapodya prolifera JEL478]|uniref:Uncharacterized protein n=1 Tax=Gonapodya prolifera (strain JEL478) TaxID=1344416 RepID=A0A138ZXK3_GONPJ|nr:hypothetical protein M427DRAFT_64604 [Gonapodya prolifera JEL478]|eukprot:KXS09228.1 hypothetical protein M427DRAFT_64604 [Gonapodya prolifera JEL478]